jgi:hypothetical protein
MPVFNLKKKKIWYRLYIEHVSASFPYISLFGDEVEIGARGVLVPRPPAPRLWNGLHPIRQSIRRPRG